MAEETQEIKEITLSEIDPRYARQIENAEKNLSKSPDYAIDICNTVLGKYPNCVEVRKILRQAQYAKYGKGSAITKFVASIKGRIATASKNSASNTRLLKTSRVLLTMFASIALYLIILFSNMIDNYRYCGIVLMGDGNERL